MLSEIAGFVESKDFKRFFSKYIKKSIKAVPVAVISKSFNKKPKNVSIRRSISPTKSRRSLVPTDSSLKRSQKSISMITEGREKTEAANKKKTKLKIIEFTCGLLDLPALKRKYLSKEKREKQKEAIQGQRRKSFVVPDSRKAIIFESLTPVPKFVTEEITGINSVNPILKHRKRVSNIRLTKDDKQVVTSVDEDSISSSSSSTSFLSNVIIKMEVGNIKHKFQDKLQSSIKKADDKYLNKLYKKKMDSNGSLTGKSKIKNLQNFMNDDGSELSLDAIKKRKYKKTSFSNFEINTAFKGFPETGESSPVRRMADI